jgi:hypothetical protein
MLCLLNERKETRRRHAFNSDQDDVECEAPCVGMCWLLMLLCWIWENGCWSWTRACWLVVVAPVLTGLYLCLLTLLSLTSRLHTFPSLTYGMPCCCSLRLQSLSPGKSSRLAWLGLLDLTTTVLQRSCLVSGS